MNSYQKFLRLGISLAPLGIRAGSDEPAYFCTPKGASLIGWAGTDGIHYCFVRGFGETVFAVSPMNTAPDYVHPLAENFTDLLRLLLACGGAAALEQAWMWDKAQFESFLQADPATEEQKKTLAEIAEKTHLTAMEQPWAYIRSLQASFDYSSIPYTDDYYDMDMNPAAQPAAPEWKVWFEGSFWGHQGRDRAGTEIPLGKQFEWAGRHWLVPAAYSCSKGLVVDFCMRVEPEAIRAFRKKWDLTPENDGCETLTREQQMEQERDDPLCFDFHPCLKLNGKKMRPSHGCSVTYDPCLPDGVTMELAAQWAAAHYGLDTAYGWVICRNAFPWAGRRRPVIQTLSLTMEQEPVPVPGPHFTVHAPGDTFRFVHPVSRTEYTLTAQELTRQTLPEDSFGGAGRWRCPRHFTMLCYTIRPEPAERMTVSDCDDGDRPALLAPPADPLAPAAVSDACIGIIGGAAGPTVMAVGAGSQGGLCTACSSLYFEPMQQDAAWRITCYDQGAAAYTLALI